MIARGRGAWTRRLLGDLVGRGRCARRLVSVVALGGLALPAAPARADNLRCHQPALAPGPAGLVADVRSLWHRVGDPGQTAAQGPLGCPLDTIPGAGGPKYAYAQRFARGWILTGGQAGRPRSLVAIRGINEWWLLWGASSRPAIVAGRSGSTWTHTEDARMLSSGEHVATLPATDTVALYYCPATTTCDANGPGPQNSGWVAVTPRLGIPPGPAIAFDFGAFLDPEKLIDPSASTLSERRAAAFPSWLPCYVANPDAPIETFDPAFLAPFAVSPDISGEDALGQAILMMRRGHACPVTGRDPAEDVSVWFAFNHFPSGALPGTTSDSAPCERDGDLDVTILGVLHVLYADGSRLTPAARNHMAQLLKPWGGTARKSQYITPDGSCFNSDLLETENHLLMQETGRYLIDQYLVSRGETGARYQTASNGTRDWLLGFLRLIVRRDFYEYNALPYTRYSAKALYLLRDYAQDKSLRNAADGVLDWLFAKFAAAENMHRDTRPYRRQPRTERYGDAAWIGSGTDPLAIQADLFAGGGLQYLLDPANLIDPAKAKADFTDLGGHLHLATLDSGKLAELSDVADTGYHLPRAISSWLADRYRDDDAVDSTSYLQEIHHQEEEHNPYASKLFVQWNDGAELYSGNRNWTITAGGIDVGPADPASPPGTWATSLEAAGAGALAAGLIGAAIGSIVPGAGTLLGAIIGLLIGFFGGLIAGALAPGAIQTAKLWDDQPGVMRETALVPSGSGLDRSQTLRFEFAYIASRDGSQPGRMCVVEGFMCGYDLRWPANPLPGTFDANKCRKPDLPPGTDVEKAYLDLIAKNRLGCLVSDPRGEVNDQWRRWTFASGQLILDFEHQPPSDADWAIADVETPDPNRPEHRMVRMQWGLPTRPYDWFDVHAYRDSNHSKEYLRIDGDPDNPSKHSAGHAAWEIPDPNDSSDLHGGTSDAQWAISLEGCNHTHPLLVFSGHHCDPNLVPSLDVNVAPLPKEPFACDFDNHDLRDRARSNVSVLTIGCGGRYGMYLYIFDKGCTRHEQCPPGNHSYGFAIAAPSRNWSEAAFAHKVDQFIVGWEAANGPYLPASRNEVLVPFGATSSHRVDFHWRVRSRLSWAINADSGPAGPIVAALTGDIGSWPLALSSVAVAGQSAGQLIVAPTGDGCFTVTGVPSAAEPRGLIVDLRDGHPPLVAETTSAQAASAC